MKTWLILAVLCVAGMGAAPATRPASEEAKDFRAFAGRLRPLIEAAIVAPATTRPADGKYGTFHTVRLLGIDVVRTDSLVHPIQAVARFRSYRFTQTQAWFGSLNEMYSVAFARDALGRWMLVRGTRTRELHSKGADELPVSGVAEELQEDWMREAIEAAQK